MKTEILPTDSRSARALAVQRAVTALRAGQVVALPTETVYGLAADALKTRAALRIFAAKERPRFDPLIVHLPAREWLPEIARVEGTTTFIVDRLISEFWPGPLTLVLPKRRIVPDVVAAGLRTVAVRMSAHKLFAEIVGEFARPVAAPSANRFGKISPTSADDVREELGGRIPLIIDAGRTMFGIESTVVAVAGGRIEILRRGPVTAEQLRRVSDVTLPGARGRPRAPGQLASHYAPRTPLRLVKRADEFVVKGNVRCGLLAWEAQKTSQFIEVRRLSARQSLKEAAANLFRLLRDLDRHELDLIVAEAVPERDLGSAIMERLRRAARTRR